MNLIEEFSETFDYLISYKFNDEDQALQKNCLNSESNPEKESPRIALNSPSDYGTPDVPSMNSTTTPLNSSTQKQRKERKSVSEQHPWISSSRSSYFRKSGNF